MSPTHYSVFAMMQRVVARCKQLKPRRNTKSDSNQETRNVIVAVQSEVCNSRMSDERWGILPAECDLMLDRLGQQGSRRCLLPVAP